MLTSTQHNIDEAIRNAVATGDLAGLDEDARAAYYTAVCESVGLNPLTRPLEYLELNGRLTLYAKRDATDQLRRKYDVSIEIVDRTTQGEVYIVRARATLPDGRTDESLGAVSLVGLEGETLANALMKAETKAKRRVALSICGLGMLDETEVTTLPGGSLTTSGSAEAEPRRLGPGTLFQAWGAQGHASRDALYAYVRATFGKRVMALSADELSAVQEWITMQADPVATAGGQTDAA
jgi:hypothetical protein